MDITWQEAISNAIRAAHDAETILANPKTPSGAQGIGYAKLAGSWATIAIAVNESILTIPNVDLAHVGNGHPKP
jgi:hypothetical protein